jgi:uncharacterized membrane protein
MHIQNSPKDATIFKIALVLKMSDRIDCKPTLRPTSKRDIMNIPAIATVKSQADSEHFSKNNKVLMHIQNSPKDATILEKKRDSLTALR